MNQEITIIEDRESALGGFMGQSNATSQAIQLAAAVLDKRITTARSFPRKISRFKSEAIALLQEDLETAASAEYAKPVGGGTVKGPSVRLAELAAMCWGNLELTVDEPIIGEKNVTVIAKAWDLERNYSAPGMATTSILNRQGQRYAAHMVETAALATASKARRNAILAVIPKSYIADLLKAAKEVTSKHKEPLDVTRTKMLDFFARTYKVQPEQVFAFLEVGGSDDIKEDQIDELRAVVTAIKEGEPVDVFFSTKAASKAEEVKAKIAARKTATAAKPEPAKAEAPNGTASVPPPPPTAEAAKVEPKTEPKLEPEPQAKPNPLIDYARRAKSDHADIEHAVDLARFVAALDADLATVDPKHKSGDLAAIARRAAGVKDRTDIASFTDAQYAKAMTAIRAYLDELSSDMFAGAGGDKPTEAMKH